MLTVTVQTHDSLYRHVSVFDSNTTYQSTVEKVTRTLNRKNFSISIKSDEMAFFKSINTDEIIKWSFD